MSHPSEPADLMECLYFKADLEATVAQAREGSAVKVQPLTTFLSAHFSVVFISVLGGDWGVNDKGLRLQPAS